MYQMPGGMSTEITLRNCNVGWGHGDNRVTPGPATARTYIRSARVLHRNMDWASFAPRAILVPCLIIKHPSFPLAKPSERAEGLQSAISPGYNKAL
jgi:hypothetical protein